MAGSWRPFLSSSVNGPLDIQVSYRLGVPLLYLKGEVDHQTASRLRVVIDEEWGSRPHVIILDLSEVTYVDSGGLSLIFDTLARLDEGGWLGAVGTTPPVARIMEMTGLTDRPELRMFPDLAAAITALDQTPSDSGS